MSIALPDYSAHLRNVAVEVLDTLSASIHWMRIPTDEKQREIMIRRWAGGIADAKLTDEAVRKAVAHYLNKRWAKDPIPEPRDVFSVSDEQLTEWGESPQERHSMRLVRRYLTIAHNWDGLPDCERSWGGTGLDEEHRPDNLPELLEAMGEPELAHINRNHN